MISSEPRVKKITFSDKIAALAHIFPINDILTAKEYDTVSPASTAVALIPEKRIKINKYETTAVAIVAVIPLKLSCQ